MPNRTGFPWLARALCLALAAATLSACGSDIAHGTAGPATGQAQQAFINGEDNRLEYFELSDSDDRSLMAQSVVALMPDTTARELSRGDVGLVPTWGEVNDLCSDQPFVDQPSAAFCSGVLVDWDLVLTSGHCVDIVPLTSLRVVFNYYFAQPGELALTRDDVYRVSEVVLARDDTSSLDEQLDFGWLRLSTPARPPHLPAAVRSHAPEVELGDAVIAINAGGGVPLKFDAGGQVRDLRTGPDDYFVADTDTSEGSSGGAAFNASRVLVGTLARGAPDFFDTSAGCAATDREDDPRLAREQFTYAYRSVAGLCELEPDRWLCDSSCETSDCEPPPPPSIDTGAGCALAPEHASNSGAGRMSYAVLLAAALRRRRRC